MRKILLFAISAILFASCGDPGQPAVVIKKERIPVEITEADLFKGNIVMAFLDNETKFIKEANALFLKGVDAYRNKKDLDSAEYYLRHSLVKEPTARGYFELGNLNMDKKNYDLAMKAYGMAEQLDYQPFSQILYNKACIHSLREDTEQAGRYLEYALQAGYSNIDHIDTDPDLENLRNEGYAFRKSIEKGIRGTSNAKNLFWLQFKKSFPKVDFPAKLQYSMSYEEAEALKYISFDYEKYISEMRDLQFSREVSKGFYFYGQPYENDNFVAIVYIVKEEFMGEFAPLTYRLATFTHDGVLIDKMDIGGRELYEEPLKIATLKKNMTIDIEYHEVIYEKDADEYGFYDNPITDLKLTGKAVIKIDKRGKITEKASDLAMN